jgi:uncharacterized integral membrane protein
VRLSTYLIGIPVVAVAAVLAVANRGAVRFSLDPFSASHPALAVEMPLWLLLLLALIAGILLGWLVALAGRRRS